MATGSSHTEPVTADDVLMAQFTFIKKGGYDQQEVDAFLDRIAATVDADSSIALDGSLTAADVRNVEFAVMKRGGYSPEQVDTFLDRVVAVFTTRIGTGLVDETPAEGRPDDGIEVQAMAQPPAESVVAPVAEPEPLPEPEPQPEPEPVAVVAEPVPVVAVAPSVASTLPSGDFPQLHDPGGAAQRLLAAAQLVADSLTADADGYAARVRAEVDQHAATTRTEADEHAAAISGAAEDQAAAIREVAADEARRVVEEVRNELVSEIAGLETRKRELESRAAALETQVDVERARILGIIDGLRSAVSEPVPAADAVAAPAPADDVEVAAVAEPDPEPEPEPDPDPAPVVELVGGDDGTDGTASVARSVFDISPEGGGSDTSTDWLDEPAAGDTANIFDIESAGGDATQAVAAVDGAGDRFFEELRQADPDADSLGPLDEDTDAALSAFFDEGDERPTDGRWRDRFGPNRD